MKKLNYIVKSFVTFGVMFNYINASAEIILPKPSSVAKVSQRIGVTDFEVEYSSPAIKGRKVFGELVKYGEVWRTGANMCTSLTVTTPATIAGKEVPKGKYCLFTIPNEKSWTVILNGEGNQPGSIVYDVKNDVMRAEVKPIPAVSTERMTFTFSDFDDNQGMLNLSWEKIKLSIPLKVDTKKLVDENIEALDSESSAADYADAAKFVFTEMNDLDRALDLVDESIEKEETWNNKWIKAQILAKKGEKEDAIKLAEESLKLSDDSVFFKFFKPSIEKSIVDWK